MISVIEFATFLNTFAIELCDLDIASKRFFRSCPSPSKRISPANRTPEPNGFVNIIWSPTLALSTVLGWFLEKPPNVNPITSSFPKEVWPPTIFTPLAPKTLFAPSIISSIVRFCMSLEDSGIIIFVRANSGSDPIAQISPKAWVAVILLWSHASFVNDLRWSVVKAWNKELNFIIAASSPILLTICFELGSDNFLKEDSKITFPTFEPQPPQSIFWLLLRAFSISLVNISLSFLKFFINFLSIKIFNAQTHFAEKATPFLRKIADSPS